MLITLRNSSMGSAKHKAVPLARGHVYLVLEHTGIVYKLLTSRGEIAYVFDTDNVKRIL